MKDTALLFIKALCLLDETSDDLYPVFKDGHYSIESRSGKPVDTGKLKEDWGSVTVSEPLPFESYPEVYAEVYRLGSVERRDSPYSHLPDDGRFTCKIVGECTCVKYMTSTCLVLMPNGLLYIVGTNDFDAIAKCVRDNQLFEASSRAYADFRDTCDYVVENYTVLPEELTNVKMCDCSTIVRKGRFGVELSWGYAIIRSISRDFDNKYYRWTVYLFAYLISKELKRGKHRGSAPQSTDGVEERLSELLCSYLYSIRLSASEEVCAEVARIVHVSCNDEVVRNISKFLELSMPKQDM